MNLLNIIHSKDARTATVKKNIIASLAIKGVSIIVSLLLVPLTLGYVSSELYGIWLTLSSVMLWLNFFDVGFTLGLKNKLAEAIALNEWEKGKSLVSTTYFMMVILFLPLCLVLELTVPYINWARILNVDIIYNPEITKTMHALVFFFCMQMIFQVITAVVAAFQKTALSSAFTVIGNFLSLLVVYILTKCIPPSLTALAYAIAAMPVMVLFISSVILYRNRFKRISPSLRSIDKKYIRNLFGLGVKFFLIQIQVVILFQTTNVLISNLSGPNDVTSYNIAYKYISVGMMIYNIILTPLWPAFTDAYTIKDYVWMNKIYKKMQKVFWIAALLVLLMVLVSPVVYKLWIGNKTIIPIAMTIIVAIYVLVYSWDQLQVLLINGIGTVKLQTYITTIGLIVHIPLSIVFGNYVGCYGVLFSMIAITLFYSVFFTIQIRKLLSQKATGIWIK